MSYYYDEQTETKYYEPTMVIEFRQIESKDSDCDVEDMHAFIIYDYEEDLIYVFGSRKKDSAQFVKAFDSEKHAYEFLDIMMGFDRGYFINTSVYYMSDLTDYSKFDDFAEKAIRKDEISGYDRELMTLKKFRKYLSVIF